VNGLVEAENKQKPMMSKQTNKQTNTVTMPDVLCIQISDYCYKRISYCKDVQRGPWVMRNP
jgi:hypothetical protein